MGGQVNLLAVLSGLSPHLPVSKCTGRNGVGALNLLAYLVTLTKSVQTGNPAGQKLGVWVNLLVVFSDCFTKSASQEIFCQKWQECACRLSDCHQICQLEHLLAEMGGVCCQI